MILVTGATGNAGGAVVRALASSGERVRALVRDADGSELPASVGNRNEVAKVAALSQVAMPPMPKDASAPWLGAEASN